VSTVAEHEPAPEPDSDNARIAIFSLRRQGGGSIWLSDEVCTPEQLDYLLEFLDQVRLRVLELRDDDPSLET
jgi:hypothetical protein